MSLLDTATIILNLEKKYQILDRFKESPQLPFGYPASILISFIPPLWFKIMNDRIPKEMILEKG